MQKQILKNETSLKKVSEGIEKCLNGTFLNNELIFQLLSKRKKILEKTKQKLIRLNLNNLVEWEEAQKSIIS